MYRLNCKITDEAEEFLKQEAKRFGSSMGTIVTMLCLQKKREDSALSAFEVAKLVASSQKSDSKTE